MIGPVRDQFKSDDKNTSARARLVRGTFSKRADMHSFVVHHYLMYFFRFHK
jgi:hypothetical protein